MADDQAGTQSSDELAPAIAAAKKNPADPARWDRVEELLETLQEPAPVSDLFMSALNKRTAGELVEAIGPRGVRFYETWFGEASEELARFLQRVLQVSPGAHWAFERLTVAYTVGERWSDLLDAYDRAIEAADHTSRRMKLLEEAAQVAKDFASAPDRAIGYMLRLHALEPDNSTLAAALERLLERQERWEDLVALFQSRLSVQGAKQARDSRVRMAGLCLDKLGRHGDALEHAMAVLLEADHEPALQLVERVLSAQGAAADERRKALQHLKQRYLEAHKQNEIVRVLESGLGYAQDAERKALLRELVERLTDLGQDGRASRHQAELLVLDPLPRERDTLLALCERTRDKPLFAKALRDAAERCEQASIAGALRLEAARTFEQAIGDEAAARELYDQVFRGSSQTDLVLEAGRRLIPLLEGGERESELLQTISRLAELEPEPSTRRLLLGKAARHAHGLGDRSRAEQVWRARLQEDPHDVEALDALVTGAAEDQSWKRLAELLEQRIEAPAASQRRRADLVLLASTYAERLEDLASAIEVWRRIQQSYGEDSESVTALTDLLSRAERWPELADVLSEAAARQIARFTELQTQLGDAYRQRLAQPERAAERYRSALQVDPRCERALSGQQALVTEPAARSMAVGSLTEAYGRNGDHKRLLALLEPRLLVLETAQARAAVLIEAAKLHEAQERDLQGALGCLRRAFALTPDDRGVEKDIRRLAESLGAWDAVVSAYRETLASLPRVTPRAAELRHDEARVLYERLGDRAGALAAYAEAVTIAPERVEHALPATRLAGELGRFDAACAYALACMRARGSVVSELLEALQAAAAAASAWDTLVNALGAELASKPTDGKLAQQLYATLATWHEQERKDTAQAQAALEQALAAFGDDAALLLRLVALLRKAPSEALCDALLALFALDQDDLDPLLEATEAAQSAVADSHKRRAIGLRLFERAADLLRSGREAKGQATAAACARAALDRLVPALLEAEAHERALQLLLGAAALPLGDAAKRADLHRAAQIAAGPLQDPSRAIALQRELLQSDGNDRVALRELQRLCETGDRLPELLALKRHELGLERDRDRQVALRLEVAALLSGLEARGGRLETLQENLRACPGHGPTLEALSELLTAQRRQVELAALLRRQGQELVRQGEVERAAELVKRTAALYEQFGDAGAAIDTYRELHELDPAGEGTAALARLYAARGDHAQAAKWLELRLGTAPPETRAVTAVELAQALLEAGERQRARACLEQALREDPKKSDARALLSDIYRSDAAWEPLAGLLLETAGQEPETAKRLALLREAAAIYRDTLKAPERAIAPLERAVELAPDDRELRLKLADTLCACNRHDRAKTVLEHLIEGFGRKRSPERAELHYRLACVLRGAGNASRALVELDAATKMDPAHVQAMALLAELSQELGDLDRAERTYRGLLMLVRRQKPGELLATGPSEVFYALSTIAGARGQAEQAKELLESAMEAATQHDTEAERFQTLLRKRAEVDLLLRVLDVRLSGAEKPVMRAEILAAKAEVLADVVGKHAAALKVLLSALALAPESDALHEKTLALAAGLGELDSYLERLAALSEEAHRKRDAKLFAKLTLRLGEAIEHGLSDLDRAAGLYAKVESSGELVVDAWMALARVAGARGDRAEQRRVLSQIADRGPEQVSVSERRTALFALVELELASEAWRDSAPASLERALLGLTDYERPKALLRAAMERAPEHQALAALFERVARAAHDHDMLLAHVERRAMQGKAGFEQLREGIELALRIGDSVRAQALLELARAQTGEGEGAEERSLWVYARLADCKQRARDIAGAVACLEQALSFAHGADAEGLCRRLADLASGPGGDLEVAIRAYQRLLDADRSDASLWQPLLQLYRQAGDRKRFESFAQALCKDLLLPADRVLVRLAQAKFLIEAKQDDRAAVPALKRALEEEPGHPEATDVLTQILQKHGMNEELAELLHSHFDRARDEQNLAAIAELAVRIGGLYADSRPEAAIDIYRSALQWVPEHKGLLRALLSCMTPETDPRERADVMHALLKVEDGGEAARLAFELAASWSALSEPELAQQALEYGQKAHPEDEKLRGRLEALYAERELWRPLAELLEREAARLATDRQAVSCLKNAASLYRDQLKDLDAASAALRKALELVPEDLSLLGELARNLAAAGQHAAAIADVSKLLDGPAGRDAARIDLLKVRAELRLSTAALNEAVVDLEEAYAIAPAATYAPLVDALERTRTAAFAASDVATERHAVLRLCALHDAAERPELAQDLLSEWVEQSPEDADALEALRRRAEAAGRWHEVAKACESLLDLETGEARALTAIALADACVKVNEPAAARTGVERVLRENPSHAALRKRVRDLYEAIGAVRELANMLFEDSERERDPATRLGLLQRSSRLYLDLGDAKAALDPLGKASELQPEDAQTQLLMVDISIELGRMQEAGRLIESAINALKRKRSPELALLYQRLGRWHAAHGEHEEQIKWLNQASEIDRKSSEIASELAEAAIGVQNYDLAMKALRAITMMDEPKPISRAMAFLKQAQIAQLRGDPRRAQHWARKAKSLDDDLVEADAFLAEIGG